MGQSLPSADELVEEPELLPALCLCQADGRETSLIGLSQLVRYLDGIMHPAQDLANRGRLGRAACIDFAEIVEEQHLRRELDHTVIGTLHLLLQPLEKGAAFRLLVYDKALVELIGIRLIPDRNPRSEERSVDSQALVDKPLPRGVDGGPDPTAARHQPAVPESAGSAIRSSNAGISFMFREIA